MSEGVDRTMGSVMPAQLACAMAGCELTAIRSEWMWVPNAGMNFPESLRICDDCYRAAKKKGWVHEHPPRRRDRSNKELVEGVAQRLRSVERSSVGELADLFGELPVRVEAALGHVDTELVAKVGPDRRPKRTETAKPRPRKVRPPATWDKAVDPAPLVDPEERESTLSALDGDSIAREAFDEVLVGTWAPEALLLARAAAQRDAPVSATKLRAGLIRCVKLGLLERRKLPSIRGFGPTQVWWFAMPGTPAPDDDQVGELVLSTRKLFDAHTRAAAEAATPPATSAEESTMDEEKETEVERTDEEAEIDDQVDGDRDLQVTCDSALETLTAYAVANALESYPEPRQVVIVGPHPQLDTVGRYLRGAINANGMEHVSFEDGRRLLFPDGSLVWLVASTANATSLVTATTFGKNGHLVVLRGAEGAALSSDLVKRMQTAGGRVTVTAAALADDADALEKVRAERKRLAQQLGAIHGALGLPDDQPVDLLSFVSGLKASRGSALRALNHIVDGLDFDGDVTDADDRDRLLGIIKEGQAALKESRGDRAELLRAREILADLVAKLEVEDWSELAGMVDYHLGRSKGEDGGGGTAESLEHALTRISDALGASSWRDIIDRMDQREAAGGHPIGGGHLSASDLPDIFMRVFAIAQAFDIPTSHADGFPRHPVELLDDAAGVAQHVAASWRLDEDHRDVEDAACEQAGLLEAEQLRTSLRSMFGLSRSDDDLAIIEAVRAARAAKASEANKQLGEDYRDVVESVEEMARVLGVATADATDFPRHPSDIADDVSLALREMRKRVRPNAPGDVPVVMVIEGDDGGVMVQKHGKVRVQMFPQSCAVPVAVTRV